MVSVNALPAGEYEVSHGVILTGAADGTIFTVGDRIRVKCVSANVNGGFIDFEIVKTEKAAKSAKSADNSEKPNKQKKTPSKTAKKTSAE